MNLQDECTVFCSILFTFCHIGHFGLKCLFYLDSLSYNNRSHTLLHIWIWIGYLTLSNKPTQNPVGEPGYLRLSSKPTQNPVGEPGYLWLSNKPTQNPVGQPGYLSLNKIKWVIVDSKKSWVWRYQRSNQNPHSEEEQTTQWPKKCTKGQITIYKTYT